MGRLQSAMMVGSRIQAPTDLDNLKLWLEHRRASVNSQKPVLIDGSNNVLGYADLNHLQYAELANDFTTTGIGSTIVSSSVNSVNFTTSAGVLNGVRPNWVLNNSAGRLGYCVRIKFRLDINSISGGTDIFFGIGGSAALPSANRCINNPSISESGLYTLYLFIDSTSDSSVYLNIYTDALTTANITITQYSQKLVYAFSQDTVANAPPYNLLNGIEPNAANSHFLDGSANISSFTSFSSFTLMSVMRLTSATARMGGLQFANSGVSTEITPLDIISALNDATVDRRGDLATQFFDSPTNDVVYGDSAVAQNEWAIWAVTSNGARWRLWKNGLELSKIVLVGADSGKYADLIAGLDKMTLYSSQDFTPTYETGGDKSRVLYEGEKTDAELISLFNYFNHINPVY